MSEIAGRVLMIPKGTYSPTTTYDPLDAVKYEQNSYVCKQTSRGNLPTNTTYWQPLTDVTADENPTEDSTNLVQSGGVYSALRTINQTLTSAFANNVNENGSKNKLYLDLERLISDNTGGTWNNNKYTYRDGEFTINEDSITFGGTPTNVASIYFMLTNDEIPPEKYVLSGLADCTNIMWGGVNLFKDGVSVQTFSINSKNNTEIDCSSYTYDTVRVEIKRNANNVAMSGTANVMLCLKSDWDLDNTFAPYSKSNLQLTQDSVTWDDLSEVGAVNFRNIEVYTKTQNGITFTVDTNKEITVSGINDGVGPSNMLLFRKVVSDKPLKVSGVPSNANNNYCCLEVYDNTSNSRIGYVTGNTPEVIIPANGHNVSVQLYVWKNQDVSTAMKFPVLIAPINYNGDYVPPAKTNKELTDELSGKVDIAGIPRQKMYRFAANSTTTTITVPLDKVSSYAQGSLHIRTSSKDSEAHITFALNQGNTSVVTSSIKNYGTVDLSLDSMTISGQVLSIVIGGGTAYQWYSAEYFASLSEGVTAEQPTWNFA